MKSTFSLLFTSVFFLIICLNSKAQDDSYNFSFEVAQNSSVVIGGSTNVNAFDCTYKGVLEKKNDRISGKSNGLILFLKGAEFILTVKEFDCENSLMTKEFGETLRASEYPKIIMEITKISFKDKESFNRGNTSMKTYMKVTAAGKPKTYIVDTKRKINSDNTVSFTGNFQVLIEDFDIEPPTKAFGLIKVNSELNIDYSLVFAGDGPPQTRLE